MSREALATESIAEMVERLCPHGVEFLPLGAIGEFKRGKGVKKDQLGDQGRPVIHYGQIYTTYGVWTDYTASFIDESQISRPVKAKHGDLLITISDVTPTNVGKTTAWLGNNEVIVGGDLLVFSHTQDPKYLSYVFESSIWQAQKLSRVTGGTVRHLSTRTLSTIEIPVPPLDVQRKIARTLDQFVILDQVLQAEIEGREKQFRELRDSRLELTGVQEIALSNVASTVVGLKGKTKSDFGIGSGHFVTYTNVFNNPSLNLNDVGKVSVQPEENQNQLHCGDVLITGSSESPDEVGMSSVIRTEIGFPLYLNSFCFAVRFNQGVDIDAGFTTHLFRSHRIRKQIEKTANGVTRFNISKPRFMKIQIPLPPLETQRRIARDLDSFNDYIENLKREKELRQKQYEGLREQLLSFPKKESA